MRAFLKKLHRNEEGQDMIEYALLASLVAIALITILGSLAGAIEATYQSIVDAL